ncbi:ArnT family glycosyltransferase [Pseudomonas moorei]|uniref:Dolichyl-phosphate-mannose-protein mannosyltransferase n=1 Tax=Pseudomonas moorei TaxID=395599 RepID=A0A1H1GTV6_9PSED|nr:glycosyltransferase family 39 protein [Pseudomonas moorei]KAB0506935.1 glycosyltransferase family 39 protein [Pseudomonas moorei]SDR16610.1 Dolichyl-phosphate-mannose-protein mannosyltransferase [Pseudomonas moorei]
MRRSLSPRVECLGLMLLALLLVGAGLGLRQVQNVDEERFLGVALEMLHNGSWLIPHRAGEIYGDKPPIFMWAVAFFAWLTGKPNLALFIPGLFSAVTVTAMVYDLGRRLWNQRIGRIAALLYLATYQTYSILRTGQIDSFLVLFTTLGLYGLARHLLLGPAWRWFYIGCAGMGIGVITKGVGFLPALMLIPYAYAVRKDWPGVVAMPGQARKWWLGLLVMLAAIAVWLLPMALSIVFNGSADEVAYAREILLRQTAGRYAASWDHREPFWYFFTNVIPQYWLPLVLALPWLVPAWRRQLKKRDGRVLVLLGWVALVVLFFCISAGKRKLYIYPALPGLVLAAAPLIPWLLQRWFKQRPRLQRVFPALVVGWFVLWFARGVIEPISDGANPHVAIMEQAASMTHGADLVLVQWREGHWLYARQPIVHFGMAESTVEQAAQWLREHPQAYALVPDDVLARCFKPEATHELGETSRAEWSIVGADADNGKCHPGQPEHVYRFSWD